MHSNTLYENILTLIQLAKSTSADDIKHFVLNFPAIYQEWWLRLYHESPRHVLVETCLIAFIVWLVFIRKTIDPIKEPKNKNLSKKEEEWLIETWKPVPLVEEINERSEKISNSMTIVEQVDGNYFHLRGFSKPVLNLSTFDFFSCSQDENAKDAALTALNKYGVGSCGPRGFYGTVDIHLILEKRIAEFMGVEEAVYYSDSASAVSSAIPSFLKKGDLLIVDEACDEAIRTGCTLSRGTVVYFKHNDMSDLRTILQTIADDDKRLHRDALQQRRFIIVEGLYRLTGDLCPLDEIMKIKEEFFYRLILDESLSFGVIGKTGRGVTEHFNVNIRDVEVITLALDTALGSVGGCCVGSHAIVDHQRLSGAGYCFSASAPPFFAAAALAVLDRLENNSASMLSTLQTNISRLRKGLSSINGFELASSDETPVMHLRLLPSITRTWEEDETSILRLANECLSSGVGVSSVKIQAEWYKDLNKEVIRPSIRICANTTLTAKEIDKAIASIASIAKTITNPPMSTRKRGGKQ